MTNFIASQTERSILISNKRRGYKLLRSLRCLHPVRLRFFIRHPKKELVCPIHYAVRVCIRKKNQRHLAHPTDEIIGNFTPIVALRKPPLSVDKRAQKNPPAANLLQCVVVLSFGTSKRGGNEPSNRAPVHITFFFFGCALTCVQHGTEPVHTPVQQRQQQPSIQPRQPLVLHSELGNRKRISFNFLAAPNPGERKIGIKVLHRPVPSFPRHSD